MIYYILTIKKTKLDEKYTSKEDLDDHLKYVKMASEICRNVVYELDSHMQLHLHAIVGFKRKPYFKKFMKKGWHIHFKEFPYSDYPNVVNYLNKDVHIHPLESNYFHYNYAFLN